MEAEEVRKKLCALLGFQDTLPEWCNALFTHSGGVEIWVSPSAEQVPEIPAELEGIPVIVKYKNPGQACKNLQV